MSDKALRKALEDAFYVCFDMYETLGSIIAGEHPLDNSDLTRDKLLRKKAGNYIKWYKKHLKNP